MESSNSDNSDNEPEENNTNNNIMTGIRRSYRDTNWVYRHDSNRPQNFRFILRIINCFAIIYYYRIIISIRLNLGEKVSKKAS